MHGVGQGSRGGARQRVDGHRLGVLPQRGQLVQQAHAVGGPLAQADDAARAHADARRAHRLQRRQPVLGRPGSSITLGQYTARRQRRPPPADRQPLDHISCPHHFTCMPDAQESLWHAGGARASYFRELVILL